LKKKIFRFFLITFSLRYLDQTLVSIKIHEYATINKKAELLVKDRPGIRLDRSGLSIESVRNLFKSKSHISDHHSFHSNIFDNHIWNIMLEIFNNLFHPSIVDKFNTYKNEYVETRNKRT
jgi:hypothetical protein